MIFNYQEICDDFLKELPERSREIIVRRFGLRGGQRETLQFIGEDLGVTRERVRQVQGACFPKLKQKVKRHEPVFDFFTNQLKTTGNLRKEEILLKVLSPDLFENQVFFLLSLGDNFDRFLEAKEFYTFWTIDRNSLSLAQKIVKTVSEKLNKISRPLETSELKSFSKIELPALLAFLEISKQVQKGPQGLWGLHGWPEINPKGVRDRAYIVFKKETKPLHFTQVARLIDENKTLCSRKKTHPQTVHNELIKDPRFVLVGRGLYALSEWGYKPGVVRDIVADVLKESKRPLSKQEILEKVLKQRFVAENTILLNLHNKKYFKRDPEGKYKLIVT